MRGYLFILLIAASVTYLTTPAVRRVARRIGAITPVRERDVHAVPIARMGGVAMLAGLVVAFATASQMPFLSKLFERTQAPYWVLLGAALIALLGVADDLWALDALTKLAGQCLAAGVMAWQGIELSYLPMAGVTIFSPATVLVLTILVVVVTINAVNFVDGLDGLAAGIVGIAALAFFVYSYALTRDISQQAGLGDYSSLASLITAATVGCCLGFLPHNVHPARLFMGDSGSMLLGLLLATSTVAVTGQIDPTVVSQAQVAPAFFPLLLPVAVLALPLLDLGWAIFRRARAGQAPWSPDKKHLHHRLMLGIGHAHRNAVFVMYAWTATVAFGVVGLGFLPPAASLSLGLIAVLAATAFTFWPALPWGRRQNHPEPEVAPAGRTTAEPPILTPYGE